MGLDQSAYAKEQPSGERVGGGDEPTFYWRKHSRLQSWMEEKFFDKNPETERNWDTFNCEELSLSQEDIDELKCHLEAGLPDSGGGFFWGHQFQGESAKEYREQDLKFCEWATEQLAEGNEVIYECWW